MQTLAADNCIYGHANVVACAQMEIEPLLAIKRSRITSR